MAIKETLNNNKDLLLEINNGDLTTLNEIKEKWSFKNYQSLIRFAASVMTLAEELSLVIKVKGKYEIYEPANDLIDKKQAQADDK